ncbi:MAG: hypothetical protein JWP40_1213 [Blastococcus sp.]|nr:hypothetical protein [Blastococcus sp.]
MKRIVLWLMSTVTVLVLVFGYHTSTSSTATAAGGRSSLAGPLTGGTGAVPGSAAAPTSGSGSGPSAAGSSPSAGSAAAASPTAGTSATSGTVTGDVAQTRWGPVQVQLTVTSGKITDVAVVQYPNGNGRDQEINSQALPILIQETVQAQNAQIDMVSGATVTSDGYLQSLQSALDRAGL